MNYQSSSFSDNIEKVIKNASKIALRFGSNLVGSEHILYGLTAVEGTLASEILAEEGVSESAMFDFFEQNADGDILFSTEVELTPRTKDLFRIAQEIALQMNHSFLGTEHLLLALLSSSGSVAYRILQGPFNVDIENMRGKVIRALQANAASSPEEKEGRRSAGDHQRRSGRGEDDSCS